LPFVCTYGGCYGAACCGKNKLGALLLNEDPCPRSQELNQPYGLTNNPRPLWLTLILTASTLALALPTAAHAASSECSEGPEVPSAVRQHRPQRTADCPYTFDEFLRRFTALTLDKDHLYTVETLERSIGVPQMTTIMDEARQSHYSVDIRGRGGWKAVLVANEVFLPVTDLKRFTPGPRPQRLYPASEAHLDLWAADIEPPPAASSECLMRQAFLDTLRAAGWTEPTEGTFTSGFLPEGRTKRNDEWLAYGPKRVRIVSYDEDPCVDTLILIQDPPKTERSPATGTGGR
jgi:hypothetical protein